MLSSSCIGVALTAAALEALLLGCDMDAQTSAGGTGRVGGARREAEPCGRITRSRRHAGREQDPHQLDFEGECTRLATGRASSKTILSAARRVSSEPVEAGAVHGDRCLTNWRASTVLLFGRVVLLSASEQCQRQLSQLGEHRMRAQ